MLQRCCQFKQSHQVKKRYVQVLVLGDETDVLTAVNDKEQSGRQALAALRQAIANEKLAHDSRETAYLELLSKIISYQKGEGPAPSIEEFLQWPEGAEQRLAMSRPESGVF